MLEEMRIRGLGVIEDAQLELGPGLTVVTGETGAGKTMLLTGLNLLMGGRADGAVVRSGTDRAVVEGRVRLDEASAILARAVDAGAEIETAEERTPGEDSRKLIELVISRTVLAGGRSRAHVGGRSAPVSLLAELADGLVAVHGQSDHHRLLQVSRQLAALDRYAGASVREPLNDYVVRYARLQAVQAQLHEVVTQARERAREADLLRLGLEEIEKVDPQVGEDVAMRAEEERLAHADGLRAAAESAHHGLSANDSAVDQADVLSLLARSRQALEGERGHDPELAAFADRLAELTFLVGDVATDLASYAARVDTDPQRLAEVQERRAVLTQVSRKYGDDVTAVLAWARTASQRLLELDSDDARIAALTDEKETLLAELGDLAAVITAARTEAARRFTHDVSLELTGLAMTNARIEVEVRPRHSLGPLGNDDVEILFSGHLGAQPRPLGKGISGGELSRLMLAIEVVFAGADPVPTFVFDEVDAGVGGKAAVEVGRRLAKLARYAQVLVVTHLPQVAAFADRHFTVVKSDDGSVTSSGVETLDQAGRVSELSRMLAGLEDSASARAHAQELLATAATAKRE